MYRRLTAFTLVLIVMAGVGVGSALFFFAAPFFIFLSPFGLVVALGTLLLVCVLAVMRTLRPRN